MTTPHPSRRGLEADVARWVAAGVIDGATAERIVGFERGRHPTVEEPQGRGGMPAVAEVVGYLGAALAGAAAAVLLGRSWGELGTAWRLAIPIVATVVLVGAAFAIGRSEEPSARRLTGLLLALGAGGVAWSAGVVASDVADASERTTVSTVGLALAVAGGGAYAYRRLALPQLALLVGLFLTLTAAFEGGPAALSVSLALLAALWMGLGIAELLPPVGVTLFFAAMLATLAPLFAMAEYTGAAAAAGVVLGAGLIVVAARRREAAVLAVGVVGLFLYVVRTITYHLEGSAATAALLLVGVALVASAVAWGRRRLRVD